MKTIFGMIGSSLLLTTVLACSPKVYIIDRPTLLEEETGGQWPELESSLRQQQVKTSAVPLKTGESSEKQKRLTRVTEPDSTVQNLNQ